MGVERVEHQPGKTIFSVRELTPYGEPDREFDVEVLHDPAGLATLPTITDAEIDKLPDDPHGDVEQAECHALPTGQTIVFIRSLDTETSSWKYRYGGHTVRGPYLWVKEKRESPQSSG